MQQDSEKSQQAFDHFQNDQERLAGTLKQKIIESQSLVVKYENELKEY